MSIIAEALGLLADRFVDWFTGRKDDSSSREVWEHLPTGCCRCGTGGPDDETGKPAVTRYLYSGVMAGKPEVGDLDWAACSRHPLANEEPILDYGNDIVVSWAQAHRDFEQAMEWRLRHG